MDYNDDIIVDWTCPNDFKIKSVTSKDKLACHGNSEVLDLGHPMPHLNI
jgi:hypothetical protein